jgi:hypothetical protein
MSEPPKIAKKHFNLIRVGVFDLDSVLCDIRERYSIDTDGKCVRSLWGEDLCRDFVIGDGTVVKVKMDSDRYSLFKRKGVKCAGCGLMGTFFALEAHKQDAVCGVYHFNLYGLDGDGDEVLFTKDHIISKRNGGKNCLENYQTMCFVCNLAKGGD